MSDAHAAASRAYRQVLGRSREEIDWYLRMSPDDELSFFQLVKITAYERAARIIDDIGVKGGGDDLAVCKAIRDWHKDFEGSHLNFATWNRHLMYSEDIVRECFKRPAP